MAKHLWGIDLGGTKREGIILNADDYSVVHRHRIPTEAAGGYEHMVSRVGVLVEELQQATGLTPTRIGLGTPGTVDPPTGLHKNSNTTIINGRPFVADVAKRLGLEVPTANDANCFAVAEARLGSVREQVPQAKLIFGIIMGTGVGGGLVIDGKPWNGPQGIGGEWGHSFLDHSGGPCYCGKTGCVERILSGPSLQHYYHEHSGTELPLQTILKRHAAGTDEIADDTVERLLHYFGKGLANLINILDPDAIILGGGLGNIDLLYTEGVRRIEDFIFNPRVETPILRPKLGDSAGVFGAAFLTE
ncbi:MAG: ROK family protein [Saprospiraceae bacterium]